jgi:predicted nucleic acid-binding protein
MVVIADTSPLNYLVLIRQIELLPRLFTEVFVPDAVVNELSHPESPAEVRRWAGSIPEWVRLVADRPNENDPSLDGLGKGERAAILFAQRQEHQALLIIDEAKGRRAAAVRQIPVIGILGILDLASQENWISLPVVLSELQRTSFWAAPALIASLIDRDRRRKA